VKRVEEVSRKLHSLSRATLGCFQVVSAGAPCGGYARCQRSKRRHSGDQRRSSPIHITSSDPVPEMIPMYQRTDLRRLHVRRCSCSRSIHSIRAFRVAARRAGASKGTNPYLQLPGRKLHGSPQQKPHLHTFVVLRDMKFPTGLSVNPSASKPYSTL